MRCRACATRKLCWLSPTEAIDAQNLTQSEVASNRLRAPGERFSWKMATTTNNYSEFANRPVDPVGDAHGASQSVSGAPQGPCARRLQQRWLARPARGGYRM